MEIPERIWNRLAASVGATSEAHSVGVCNRFFLWMIRVLDLQVDPIIKVDLRWLQWDMVAEVMCPRVRVRRSGHR